MFRLGSRLIRLLISGSSSYERKEGREARSAVLDGAFDLAIANQVYKINGQGHVVCAEDHQSSCRVGLVCAAVRQAIGGLGAL
jgi:hypothetical protein